MHEELAGRLHYFASPRSTFGRSSVLTGAGRHFPPAEISSTLHTMPRIRNCHNDLRLASACLRVLDLDKPVDVPVEWPAVGLAPTLALLCDVHFCHRARQIGDSARRQLDSWRARGSGDLAAAHRLRAREGIPATGELLTHSRHKRSDSSNHCVPAAGLDSAVDAFCERLLRLQQRNSLDEVLINLELKRVATAVMDAGIAYEAVTVRSAEHRAAVKAPIESTSPIVRTAERRC